MSSKYHMFTTACQSYVLVCHSFCSHMPFSYHLYVICIPYICIRTSFVYHLNVLVCHSYVTRMHSYVIRMSLVCTCISILCQWYVTHMYWYVGRICFYHKSRKSGYVSSRYRLFSFYWSRGNTSSIWLERHNTKF